MKPLKYKSPCKCVNGIVNPTIEKKVDIISNQENIINLIVKCPICKKEYIRIY